jgi:hypothetical protein
MRSMADRPPRTAFARFDRAFGQRFLLTVDTEDEFGRQSPSTRDAQELDSASGLARLQQFCESEGIVPVYLLDWPSARSTHAAEVLRGPVADGKAEIGVHLQASVNPPFDDELTACSRFAGNLPSAIERAKFAALRDEIERNFQIAPAIYRACLSGVGPDAPAMLVEGGVAIDSSVRSGFDFSLLGGPDFSRHPLTPYWLDDDRRLLELPPTTVFWGLLRRQGKRLFPTLRRVPRLRTLLARTGLLERIALTPAGLGVEGAIRGIDMALDDGLPLLVFSLHIPSLYPGFTPLVRNEDELEDMYDWWRRVFAYLELRKVAPTSVAEVMRAVHR